MSPAAAYRRLLSAYGPQGWWPVTSGRALAPAYRPGFRGALTERQRAEVCVGAILTQNTAWVNVEKALARLHGAGLRGLAALETVSSRRLESLVRPSGYFRQKAKKLKGFARRASERGGLSRWLSRPLPGLREELLAVWGVGPETADSILLFAADRPVFVVDAYTARIGERVGWFRGRDYHCVQRFFERRLPASAEIYSELHALFVELAKRHCRVKPSCPGCPLKRGCRHGQKA